FLITFYFLIIKYAVDTILWDRFMLLFESNKGDSVNARLMMIEKSKEMFSEAPLLGKGMGGFKEATNSVHNYPHNIIYEMLAEYGLIGFLIFSIIIIYIIFKSMKHIIIEAIDNSKFKMINLLVTLFIISFYFSLI